MEIKGWCINMVIIADILLILFFTVTLLIGASIAIANDLKIKKVNKYSNNIPNNDS